MRYSGDEEKEEAYLKVLTHPLEDNWADITVSDLDNIRDNTSRTVLDARPDGIRHVFLNGAEVVRDGSALTGKRAGKVLRHE